MSRLTIFFPDSDTKAKFKAKCSEYNESMSNVAIAMVKHYIETGELGITVEIREVKPKQDLRQCWFIDGRIEHIKLSIKKSFKGKSIFQSEDGAIFGFIDGMFRELPDEGDDNRYLKREMFIDMYKEKYL